MPLYESVFIARQDVSAQQVENMTQNFTSIIEDNGGRIAKSEYWGVRGLAYRIKKNRKGHYVMMHIDAPAGAVHEMERNIRINEDIIRYLTVKVDALEEGPSVVMLNKGSRDDRRDRGDREDRGDRHDRGDRGDRGDRRDRGDRPSRDESDSDDDSEE